MNNNLVGQPSLANTKGQSIGGKRNMGMDNPYENNRERETPQGMNRYNSSQYGSLNRKP